MPDPEGRSSDSRRRRRALTGWRGAVVRWLDPEGRGPAPPPPPATVLESDEPGNAPPETTMEAVDLVDQAEAFASLRISDLMTPRADILGLELDTPLREVVRRFAEVELTRLPVFRETLDDPVGVIHIKDVVKLIAPVAEGEQPGWDAPVLGRLMRELLYVPPSMHASDLLVRMRVARLHMALVIDEFGGSDGLITLEDLVESVVGEIDDEHDVAEEPEIVDGPDGLFEVSARTPLHDLEVRLGATLAPEDEEEEIDTVGGLVSTLAGRVPRRGELIEHPAGWGFEVVDADPRRIRRLRVRPVVRPTPADAVEPDAAEPAA